ncbi:MAG: prepilin-type N-terminal cleavage/methylation domain-containing protein [Candidatus Omnitrophica bacterium]|nr:prepilin-type N-terminal cleavage/methylation domain-containing protein [Candidatus Omnitrophota bacterium]
MKRALTLLELLIVLVIVTILSTLALTQFGRQREGAVEKEAQANLKLILAAERVMRMETGSFVNCTDAAACNNALKLSLPLAPPNGTGYWEYKVTNANSADFRGKARRVNEAAKCWGINISLEEPRTSDCWGW